MSYELTFTPESYSCRVYPEGQSSANRDEYAITFQLVNEGLGECRLHSLLKGEHAKLDEDVQMLIVREIKKLGFRLVRLEVREGGPCSHLMTKVKTFAGLDRYECWLGG